MIPDDIDDVCQMAQNLARNCGYYVFPCLPDKRPATRHGFKDASNDPAQIARLWMQHPGELIGVATGERSGIDVLDIDIKHETARAWLLTAKDKLPATRTYQTRSGGFHMCWKHAPGVRNTESVIAKGVDTRGDGGYAVFWFAAGYPCTDPSPAADWPDWLLELLFFKPDPDPIPTRVIPFPGNGGDVDRLVNATIRRLEVAPEGMRHRTLRGAACTLGGVLHEANIDSSTAARMLLDAVLQAGGARVDQRNALATIAWGLTRGAASPIQVGGKR